MTLFDVDRITKHWARFPPVRVLVAGAVGFKPAAEPDPDHHLTAEEFERMMRATGGKIPG